MKVHPTHAVQLGVAVPRSRRPTAGEVAGALRSLGRQRRHAKLGIGSRGPVVCRTRFVEDVAAALIEEQARRIAELEASADG